MSRDPRQPRAARVPGQLRPMKVWNIPLIWHNLTEDMQEVLLEGRLWKSGNSMAALQRRGLFHLPVPNTGEKLFPLFFERRTALGAAVRRYGKNLRKMERLKLKVYGWHRYRTEGPTALDAGCTTWEVMAADSQTEVARATGVDWPRQLLDLCETYNDEDIAAALSKPHVVFWRPYDRHGTPFTRVRDGD